MSHFISAASQSPLNRYPAALSTAAVANHVSSTTTSLRGQQRSYVSHFYRNRVLDHYASQPVHGLTLRQLVVFGRQLTEERLLRSANYIRHEIAIRIAHRIRDFQQRLSFIVGTNPHLSEVYELYWDAFETFRRIEEIKTLDDNAKLCAMLTEQLNKHMIVIPQLAIGVSECSDLMDHSELNKFVDEMLKMRISRRVLAEQHLALTDQFNRANSSSSSSSGGGGHQNIIKVREDVEQCGGMIGVIATQCRPRAVIQTCIQRCRHLFSNIYSMENTPEVIVDGHLDSHFTYIPEHLGYIITELLKNSMQAVIRKHAPDLQLSLRGDEVSSKPPTFPPIRLTIAEGPNTLMFRVSDEGGGIDPETLRYIWSYADPAKKRAIASFNEVTHLACTTSEQSDLLSRGIFLGFGLPMSRVYANYWGGELAVQTMAGLGTDAYLQLPKLGNVVEQVGDYQLPHQHSHPAVLMKNHPSTSNTGTSTGTSTATNTGSGVNHATISTASAHTYPTSNHPIPFTKHKQALVI
ncbi:alpha-ketoacid dehydrogenase kinase [Ramicandelaber brevisporus]|nr:alpha-ketoacid dehydrogenase kinase [Ramicandelaber brevisporus]